MKIQQFNFFLLVLALSIYVVATGFQQNVEDPQEIRKIKNLHQPVRSDIEGLVTYKVMPTSSVAIDQLDPFLFLNHHGPQQFPPNNQGLPFGPHPHKGFETVTFILDGDILHKDNSGHESVITEGGIQWMTAGKGIVHSEVSSEKFKQEGGNVEILQLWVNLPSKLKDVDPSYQGLQTKDIPEVKMDNGKVAVNLISGKWNETIGPIQSLTDVLMTYIQVDEGGQLDLNVDPKRAVFFYVVSGKVQVNGQNVDQRTLVEFQQEGSQIQVKGLQDAVLLYGHATPTNEPVVARGPFVMNSMDEIKQAYRDYKAGKFGRKLD